MTFIEKIYTELKENKITINNVDFSTRFLNRSPQYYSVIKTRKLDANNEVLVNIIKALEKINKTRKKYNLEDRYTYLESKIAEELANRTISTNNPSKHLINNVIYALQNYQTPKQAVT